MDSLNWPLMLTICVFSPSLMSSIFCYIAFFDIIIAYYDIFIAYYDLMKLLLLLIDVVM